MNPGIVYSTERGKMYPDCGKPIAKGMSSNVRAVK